MCEIKRRWYKIVPGVVATLHHHTLRITEMPVSLRLSLKSVKMIHLIKLQPWSTCLFKTLYNAMRSPRKAR